MRRSCHRQATTQKLFFSSTTSCDLASEASGSLERREDGAPGQAIPTCVLRVRPLRLVFSRGSRLKNDERLVLGPLFVQINGPTVSHGFRLSDFHADLVSPLRENGKQSIRRPRRSRPERSESLCTKRTPASSRSLDELSTLQPSKDLCSLLALGCTANRKPY